MNARAALSEEVARDSASTPLSRRQRPDRSPRPGRPPMPNRPDRRRCANRARRPPATPGDAAHDPVPDGLPRRDGHAAAGHGRGHRARQRRRREPERPVRALRLRDAVRDLPGQRRLRHRVPAREEPDPVRVSADQRRPGAGDAADPRDRRRTEPVLLSLLPRRGRGGAARAAARRRGRRRRQHRAHGRGLGRRLLASSAARARTELAAVGSEPRRSGDAPGAQWAGAGRGRRAGHSSGAPDPPGRRAAHAPRALRRRPGDAAREHHPLDDLGPGDAGSRGARHVDQRGRRRRSSACRARA